MKALRDFPLGLWLLLGLLVLAGMAAGAAGRPELLWTLAALKGLIISERYMELHQAPLAWRLSVPVWILLAMGGLLLLLP
ncbi:MAG: hypothetical protein WC326_04560 [Candidatus Delongbacteria bacterium]